MARLDRLNASLEQSVQKYDLAQYKLAQIQSDVRENRREGAVAKENLALSQRAIARRLVALYTSTPSSTLEIILGARSLDDMLARINAAKNVTSLDANVLTQVKHFRAVVRSSARKLATAKAAQSRLVAELAAEKRSVEGQIAEQSRLLSSLKGQIAHLEAVQAASEAALQRAAIARLQSFKAAAQTAQDSTVVGISAAAPDGQVVVPPSSYTGVVGVAMAQLGKPYVWAAAGPDSFDCSGLVMYSFAQIGVSLPHSSYALWNLGVAVSEDQLEPGDLVFFDGLGHVGIYVGGGSFIHAPHT